MSTSFDRATCTRRSHLICGLICFVAVAAIALPVFDQIGRRVRACDSQLADQDQLIAQRETLMLRLSALETRVRTMRQERDQLHRLIPNSPGERQLVEQLAEDCERDELTVTEFQSPEFRRCGNLECTRVRMTAECSWSALCSFLASIDDQHGLRSIEDCAILTASADNDRLVVRVMISEWSLLPTQVTQRPGEVRQ